MSDVDQRVGSYVSDVVDDCAPDRITVVSRFEAGERHAVYKASYLDPSGVTKDVAVRVSIGDDADEGAQAEREARVLQKVQGVAAPLLYDFSPTTPWFDAPAMCMQFVPGYQRSLSAASPTDIERVGSVVARLHGLPTDDLVEWLPAAATLSAYRDERLTDILSRVPSLRDPLPPSVEDRLARAVSLVNETRSADGFDTRTPLVLLHGDVGGENIVWSPEPVLIDWEYARLGDPADEVAYTFGQYGLTASQREAFWRGYREGADPERSLVPIVERVGWWEPVTLLGSALWWLERWSWRADADDAGASNPSVPKAQSHYLDQAIQRLDRFDQVFKP